MEEGSRSLEHILKHVHLQQDMSGWFWGATLCNSACLTISVQIDLEISSCRGRLLTFILYCYILVRRTSLLQEMFSSAGESYDGYLCPAQYGVYKLSLQCLLVLHLLSVDMERYSSELKAM